MPGMSHPERARAHLRVLPGHRRVATVHAGVQVVVARTHDAPFAVDGVVLEEDTWLALSTPADTLCVSEHPLAVMSQVSVAKPYRPGSVIVRRGNPTGLLAIVHDLDAEPTWRESYVTSALWAVFEAAREEGLRALRIPLLATRFGKLEPRRFTRLLAQQLDRQAEEACGVRAVWLVREDESGIDLIRALAATR